MFFTYNILFGCHKLTPGATTSWGCISYYVEKKALIEIVAVLDTFTGHGTLPCPELFVPRGLEVSALFPVFARKWQQGNVTGSFDSSGHFTLVFCACAGLTARTNLAVIGNVAFEKFCVLVIYDLLFIRAKLTEFGA
jgi:hypothetical protein